MTKRAKNKPRVDPKNDRQAQTPSYLRVRRQRSGKKHSTIQLTTTHVLQLRRLRLSAAEIQMPQLYHKIVRSSLTLQTPLLGLR